MTRTWLICAAASLVATLGLAPNDPAAEPDVEGFTSLFDGHRLDDWVMMGSPKGWSIRDGVLHSDGAMGGNWLRSKKKYADFILKAEWRVSKNGNSGVFLRADQKGEPWLTGYEVQISNEPRDDEHCTGALYGYVKVKPRPDESADTWHAFEIRCKGTQITVFSDGVKCVDFDQATTDKTRSKPLRGYIGLQDSHSPKGNYIEYRNIRIKSLN